MKHIFALKFFSIFLSVFFGGISAYAAVGDVLGNPPPSSLPIQANEQSLKNEVSAAGFMGVTDQVQVNTRFSPPTHYFRVQEKVQGIDWGDGGDLLTILIISKSTPTWSFNNGQMHIQDFFGKTQSRFSTQKNYIVVTGPDKEKVLNLSEKVRAKY